MRGVKLVAADHNKRKLVASAVSILYTLVKYIIMLGINPILATLSHASLAAKTITLTKTFNNEYN
jgi:hypothetical protein